MIYKDYTSRSRRLRCDMDALDREFIADYPLKHLFGKVFTVRYRFRGKTHTQTAYFEKLEPFCHDICPVFKYLREDGRPSKMRVSNIYSLKQIESITAKSNERTDKPSQGDAQGAARVCQDQGLADTPCSENLGTTCGQND